VARRGHPLEGRNHHPGLAAGPADPMATRETGKAVTSELPVHVRVSLTGRGLRLIHASMRKATPRFLPLGSPGHRSRTTALRKPPGEGRWSRQVGKSPRSPDAVDFVLEARTDGACEADSSLEPPSRRSPAWGRLRDRGEGPRPPLPRQCWTGGCARKPRERSLERSVERSRERSPKRS
jgi:hypothetical protein